MEEYIIYYRGKIVGGIYDESWRKLEQFDAVLEVRNAYKSIICLPRQYMSLTYV